MLGGAMGPSSGVGPPLFIGMVLPTGATETPTGFSVGVDEICGLLADGHHYYEIFGGKPWLASAFRAWPAPGVLLLGGPYLECWDLLCFALYFKVEGLLGNSVEAEGRC